MRFLTLSQTFLLATGLSTMVSGTPLSPRGEKIGHKDVVGFEEVNTSGPWGRSFKRFKPYLKVQTGCVPFPAVDKDGNWSGGLKKGGTHNGQCSSSKGQVYVRGKKYGGLYAIMYSWYMPKDNPSPAVGHRHDWEAAVVWVDDINKSEPKMVALSTSAHGKYDKTKNWDADGTRPYIQYVQLGTHQLAPSGAKGGEQPMIPWEAMTQEARDALDGDNWGSDAVVPFKDADDNFNKNLEKAKP